MTGFEDVEDWTSPGCFEVASNVYRIPLPLPNDGLRAVNAYAIVDDEGVDVIDPGWTLPQSRDRLESGLKTLDRSLGDIRQFLITHVHRDHYTQAVAIRRDFGTRVSLGIREQDSLRILQSTDRRPIRHDAHSAEDVRGGSPRVPVAKRARRAPALRSVELGVAE